MKKFNLITLAVLLLLLNNNVFSQTISISTTSLNFEDVYQDFSSRIQTYTINANSLSSSLSITSPSAFEISEDCSSFGNSITLTPSSGNIPSTTIYVRFSPTANTTYSGSISHSSSGATTKNISVNETTASSNLPVGYYNSATGNGATLKTNLHNIIDNHTSRSYSQLWTDFSSTDRLPNGNMWDMYSDVSGCTSSSYTYTYSTDQCGTYGAEGDCYNREHSFPKSWFNDASPMYTDLFHIVSSDGYVNGQRGNYPFGEVGSASYTSSNGSKKGNNTYGSYTGTVFEPIDEYKGDFARVYFYMATRYEDLIDAWDVNSTEADAILDGTTFPCYETWFLNMIIDWHNNDPVSQKEMSRNDEIYNIQGNRNPYIDNPDYVDDIWGSLTIDPEPTNHPTSFIASENGSSQIDLTWDDNDGTQAADGFLIKANNNGTFSNPSDATDPVEDSDLSDGSALVKVSHGTETFSFSGLTASTQYYFKIWPYTNSGSDIDFKTDGSPQTANATTTAAPAGGGLSDLIISEYIEGSSNNKYLEIYNGTGSDVDLSTYSVRVYSNGNTSPNITISLSSTLSDGNTYVLENNQATIYSGTADLSTGSLSFNGNDAIALYDGSSNIDVLGTIGSSTTFAQDKTLVRNSDICSPNSTYTSSEWIEYTQDNVSNLGSHTTNCNSSAPDEPSGFSATTSSVSQINLSWTQNGNGDNVIVVFDTDGSFTNPVDGTSYSVSSSALGGTIIYNGSGSSYNHTSLSSGTQYFYKAWSVDASDNYSTGITDDATTNSSGTAKVIISEVVDHSTYQNEYIELWNIGDASISIDGWIITERYSDNNTSERSFILNSSNQVNTGGSNYLTLEANEYCIIARDASSLETDYTIDNNIAIFEGGLPQMNGDERYLLEDGSSKAIIDKFGDWDDFSNFSTSGSLSYYRLDDEDGEDNTNWDNTAKASYNATPGSRNKTATGTLLPIDLISFTAEKQNKYNLIIWATASETNNSYFTLEKSFNAKDFFEIDNIKGAGNSKNPNYYQSKDFNTDNDIMYYRLKQTDFDGASTYSDVISIKNQKSIEILSNYYDGENYIINLKSDYYANLKVSVLDINGRVILVKSNNVNSGFNSLKLNLNKLKKGVYLININNTQGIVNIKFFKY